MPTPEPTWSLLDAVEQAAANPRSFFIPDRDEREALRPGDIAKVVFQVGDQSVDGIGGERMWVEVTDRARGGYVGRLTNEPVVVTDLSRGARIEFEPRHVIQLPGGDDVPPDRLAVFASERLFDDDGPGIGVATFEPTDAGRPIAGDRELSGWMLLAGDESAADVDDPERIRLPSLSWMLERHPELQAVLADHDGTAGTWLRTDDGWRRD